MQPVKKISDTASQITQNLSSPGSFLLTRRRSGWVRGHAPTRPPGSAGRVSGPRTRAASRGPGGCNERRHAPILWFDPPRPARRHTARLPRRRRRLRPVPRRCLLPVGAAGVVHVARGLHHRRATSTGTTRAARWCMCSRPPSTSTTRAPIRTDAAGVHRSVRGPGEANGAVDANCNTSMSAVRRMAEREAGLRYYEQCDPDDHPFPGELPTPPQAYCIADRAEPGRAGGGDLRAAVLLRHGQRPDGEAIDLPRRADTRHRCRPMRGRLLPDVVRGGAAAPVHPAR